MNLIYKKKYLNEFNEIKSRIFLSWVKLKLGTEWIKWIEGIKQIE